MILGKNIETGEDVHLDIKRLIKTRLLIQANSGGGKSWCARRIMEQTNKEVQQIIIDTEGEFSTLREKYDYLLVGPDGEIPATHKTADLLPKKIMQMKISAIIDLSEMSKSEKCRYIKDFLESLLRLPREFWTPLLVFIDEAHDFAPEGTKGKAESKPAVISLCSKGRKRKYCAVLMTQRGAKLDKDASAECNNKLTGLANVDIDRKKAAEDLAFTTKDQQRKLRELDPGEMYGYGSAISREVVKVKIGKVYTTHEEEDGEIIKPSKTPDNIKKLLKNFIDLPKEAEEELKTKQDMQQKINELKREVRINTSKSIQKVSEKDLDRAYMRGKIISDKTLKEMEINFKKNSMTYNKTIQQLEKKLSDIGKILGKETVFPKLEHIRQESVLEIRTKPKVTNSTQSVTNQLPISNELEGENKPLGICARKIYSILYGNQEREFTKVQVGLLSGYSTKSSGFNNSLAQLNATNLINRNNGKISIKEINEEHATEETQGLSRELWAKNLGLCSRKIFEFLLENEFEEFSKEDIAESVNYSTKSSGFNNSLAQLNSLGLIQRYNGLIKLNPELLEI